MKKAIIAPLIVGSVLLIVGGTMAGASVVYAGSFAALSTADPYVERQVTLTGDSVNITINEANNKVIVNTSETASTVSLSVYENQYEYYVSNETATDFTIDYHNDIPWNLRLFYIPVHPRTMTITVPNNYAGAIDINTTNALIDVNDISLLDSLSLESVNGYITLDKATIAGNINVHTTNSKIAFNHVNSLADITATALNAYITFDSVTAANVTAQTTNGKISAEDMIITTKMAFTTTNGQITIADIAVGNEIRLITTNGEISGNVDGPSSDYDVDSQTTNGTNNLSGYNAQTPTTADKILYVRSYNGVINISFR